MAAKKTFPEAQYFFLSIQACGDFLFGFLGLSLTYFLRFHTPLRDVGFLGPSTPSFSAYFPLILTGAVFLSGTFTYLNLYNGRLLLRHRQSISIILKGVVFWVFVFLGVSLALKFEPSVSRLFVISSCVVTFLILAGWRLTLSAYLHKSSFRDRLVQRVAIVGWDEEVAQMCDTITRDRAHPYHVEGIVWNKAGEEKPLQCASLGHSYPVLGTLNDIEAVIENRKIDILILSEMHLAKEEMVRIAETCEQHYVDFKAIPSYFQVFISGLKLQTISGLPILGVETLAINQLVNQNLKRLVDILGALVGLAVAAPLIGILALLIKKQSPGPIFFRQERIGFNHRPFHMLKLRSMHVGADQEDHLNQSTLREDPRVFSVGAFMRQWNLDELPQFWNVLKGEMSLVGPRPERTFHVQQLGRSISHYNPRHLVKPGITGWAQINGFRGDTSLKERIRHDLYYIENWSLWLDIQILFLTFIKRENAY